MLPGHARKRLRNLKVEPCFKHAGEQAFDERVNILLTDKRSFDVNLGELRLAVGPQIFIAEAAGDLKILFQPGNLQHLFVLLGGLGERVKPARAEAGRHEKVARALRRGVG